MCSSIYVLHGMRERNKKRAEKGIDADAMRIGIRPVIAVDLSKVKNALHVGMVTTYMTTVMSIVM